MLATFWENGDCPVKIWESPTKGTLSPCTWDLSQVTFPATLLLYVEGYTDGDVELCFSYNNVLWSDSVIFHVVWPRIISYDLDGLVSDEEEENPGAYVHFNVDNDNSSNNSLGAPKHPGGDYLETSTVSGEDDLMPFYIFLSPSSLESGTVLLTIPPGAKVWKSATKGSSNLVFSPGEYSWNLSDPDERSQFFNLCGTTLYIEGWMYSTGNMKLRYIDPLGNHINPEEIVKYKFIAANCGDQPKTAGEHYPDAGKSQREDFESRFSALVRCEWSITDNSPVPNWNYNCIAYSVDENNVWYTIYDIADNYGSLPRGTFEPEDMDDFYATKKGWSLITTGTDEEKAEQAEAMYYSGFHAARRRSCICGSGRWIMYGSKCGPFECIEHVWDQLGSYYGTPIRFYK